MSCINQSVPFQQKQHNLNITLHSHAPAALTRILRAALWMRAAWLNFNQTRGDKRCSAERFYGSRRTDTTTWDKRDEAASLLFSTFQLYTRTRPLAHRGTNRLKAWNHWTPVLSVQPKIHQFWNPMLMGSCMYKLKIDSHPMKTKNK